jgi:hypothetical protein
MSRLAPGRITGHCRRSGLPVVSVVYNHASGGLLVVKEEPMPLYVRAFLIGMIVGVRSLTAPAVLSRAVHLGWLLLENTGLRFPGDGARPTS